MNRRMVGVGVAAVLGLALAVTGGKASAGGLPRGGPGRTAGPIVFKNESGVALRITVRSYVNASGREVALRGEWEVGPRFFGYLLVGGNKVSARQLKYTVTTPEGSTDWTCNLRALDRDGDFVVVFSDANYGEHILVVSPDVPPEVPPGDAPAGQP